MSRADLRRKRRMCFLVLSCLFWSPSWCPECFFQMKSDPVWDPQVWRRDRRAAPGDQEGPVNLSGTWGTWRTWSWRPSLLVASLLLVAMPGGTSSVLASSGLVPCAPNLLPYLDRRFPTSALVTACPAPLARLPSGPRCSARGAGTRHGTLCVSIGAAPRGRGAHLH